MASLTQSFGPLVQLLAAFAAISSLVLFGAMNFVR